MSDSQFRLPRRTPRDSADQPTTPISREELAALGRQDAHDPAAADTGSMSREELDALLQRGRREQVGRLPDAGRTEGISRAQVEDLRRRGTAEPVGRLPDAASPQTRADRRSVATDAPSTENRRWWQRKPAVTAVTEKQDEEATAKKKTSLLREVGIVVAIALVMSMLVKTFLLQPFWIPSGSMENTLVRGDRVVVSKLTPGLFELERGDVVVFSDDEGWLDTPNVKRSALANVVVKPLQFVGLYPEGDNHLIKRLIGLPGDRVSCTPGQPMQVNETPVQETYLFPGDQACQEPFDIVVPPDRLWVMGDHRSASSDSRAHDEDSGGKRGSIPISSVTGRAVAIVWPVDRMGRLNHHSSTFDKVPTS
ncbi:signal peptidase I [Yimella sp. cx-51]|uniref:signal peptidase I n=1 Tax=Yimella sp. cx-51 TaxID=2770551 RepID=UPI001FCAB5FD|nr:signal peptidase I [Yimella sp. cx-51]